MFATLVHVERLTYRCRHDVWPVIVDGEEYVRVDGKKRAVDDLADVALLSPLSA